MERHDVVIKRFVGGPLMTVCYVLIVPDQGAVMIDAPQDAWHAALAAADASHAPVRLAIATHGHWDHITALARIRESGILVAGHPADQQLFVDPHGHGLAIPFVVDPVILDHPVQDGDRLMIGPITVHVLHTPGHTPGGITLWVPEADALFTGDTLLKGGAGHTAEPDASLASLRASVERLGQFPDSTQVYPGHGAPTSIGSETWLATLADPTAPVRQWRASSKRRHSGPSV